MRSLSFLVGLVLILAGCGGSDEPSDASPAAPAGDTTTTASPTTAADTTTTATTATTAAPADPADDFCEFVVAYAAETNLSPVGLSPSEVEDLFTSNVAAINQAATLAPAELQGDVLKFADAYGGFVELLAEVDFNFLAMAGIDQDDPRLAALEDPELEEAGNRIEAYCGIDNFIATAPAPPADPGSPGGGDGGVVVGGNLPDDFPTELIVAGAELVVVVENVGGVDSVTYDVALAAVDVIAFYEDLLGVPSGQLSDPAGALWITTYSGSSATVTVAETDATTTQVNITLG